jgi:hypothetical protein
LPSGHCNPQFCKVESVDESSLPSAREEIAKWPNGQMAKWPNGKMTKSTTE